MAAPQLTEGAMTRISTEGNIAEYRPTVQVTDVKAVQAKLPNANDRYRMVLSDGTHSQQAMLATQINHLVKDGHLRSGSVVQLLQFTCSSIQGRKIIIITEMIVIVQECALIGNPVRILGSVQTPSQQPGNVNSNLQSPVSTLGGSVVPNLNPSTPSLLAGNRINQMQNNPQPSNYAATTFVSRTEVEPSAGFSRPIPSGSLYGNQNVGLQNLRPEFSQPRPGAYSRPQSAYQQPPPMYMNRGPVAKNEAPPRIIPIAALNPYQGRWIIKARVTAKGEMRHYNNTRGDGKVFSFDLLDSDGGEIRVTCFNTVADQFYHQIEAGKVYLLSRGSLKPAQKNFNHLRNDLEIFLESQSTIQPCFDDDNSIPRQQFHFRPISDVEGMDNNSVMDVIGVVSSITPTTSIMRKNGTESQKRTLQLKDMSGRSVELTLWGNFCQVEGQRLQDLCDSGCSPVLAIKSCRVNDFNGKSVGTISTSQLFMNPDFPETHQLKEWFDMEGKSMPSVSISREVSSGGRADVLKTISQIKDEKLGTSEKPDWITVNSTIIFVKADNFCYTACPIMVGDRPCSKKVTNNGDGKWRCERCDQSVDECDYRYILQFQIQDHTGVAWVTTFQECGEEIMGISAKDLHYMKHENQDDEGFSKILRQVLFTRYMFKLKVKEETFSDEQRVKSTIVKAEKVNYSTNSRFLLDQLDKLKLGDAPSAIKGEAGYSNAGMDSGGFRNGRPNESFMSTNAGNQPFIGAEMRLSTNQMGQYGNQYSSRFPASGTFGSNMNCSSCGAAGHNSNSCPSIMSAPVQSSGGSNSNRVSTGAGSGGVSGECFKCHQVGHWSRDCPGLNNVPPAYGSGSMPPGAGSGGASGECYKCHQVGHWARDCPGLNNVPPAYGSGSMPPGAGPGGASGECYKCHQVGHWARDCPGLNNVPPAYGSGSMSSGRFGGISKQQVGGF